MFKVIKKILFILLFVLSYNYLFAQPVIDVYLSSRTPTSKGQTFQSVEETHEVLAIKNGKAPTFKLVKKYNPTGKLISETKYNSAGGIQYETIWEYNFKGEPTRKFTRQFVNYKGWATEETILKYNDSTGCLKEIQVYYEKLLRQSAQVVCDSTGKITEVNVYNENGVSSNIERLVYIPANNSIKVLNYKSNEQFVNATTYPLDPSKPEPKSALKREFYPNGEIMLEMLESSKSDQGYYYEYKYDSYGNWIEKLTYQCTVAPNNKVKNKKLEYLITRKITY